MSLQDDHDRNEKPISLGFFGEDFILSGFTSVRGDERTYVDLAAQHGREAVTGPHVTLHGAYFHIRSKRNASLFEALVWTDPGPGQDETPWLRAISPPLRSLRSAKAMDARGIAMALLVPSLDCSVGVHFDFVRPDLARPSQITRVVSWGGVTLRVYAYKMPPQEASLEWIIEG